MNTDKFKSLKFLISILFLFFSVTVNGQTDKLDGLLNNLEGNSSTINSLIPNRHNFSDGITGFSIADGGGDMFDGGNYLSTSFGGNIPYSNKVIKSNAYLGNTGKYFTAKYTGLFVFASKLDNVAEFIISGSLGADGSGTADELVIQNSRYKGFVKRVYGSGDPSVNHLIIVENIPGINHEIATNTNNDYHRVTGLTQAKNLYYLLYSSSDGSAISEQVHKDIFQSFVNLIPAGDTLAPKPITDLSAAQLFDTGALFTWTSVSDDSLHEAVQSYEVRLDTLEINPDSVFLSPKYAHSVMPSEPGEIDTLYISNLQPERKYWLSVRAVDEANNYSSPAIINFSTKKAPTISISPGNITIDISLGDTVKGSFNMANTGNVGSSPLSYSLTESSDENSPFVYITDNDYQRIVELNLVTSERRYISTGGNPFDVIKIPNSNLIWVADLNNDRVTIIDVNSEVTIKTFSYQNLKKIFYSTANNSVYVFDDNSYIQVYEYHPTTVSQKSHVQLNGLYNAYDFHLSPAGSTIYAIYDNNFYIYSAINGQQLSNIYLNNYAYRFVVSHDNRYAYAYGNSGFLTKINLTQRTAERITFSDEIGALSISMNDKYLYVGLQHRGYVSVISTISNNHINNITNTPTNTVDMKVSSDGKFLHTLHDNNVTFTTIDLNKQEIKNSYTVVNNTSRFSLSGLQLSFLSFENATGILQPGENKDIEFSVDASNLQHKDYQTKIKISSSDPLNPEVSIPILVRARDTKGPDFNITFFQNIYLSNFLKVLVFANEKLDEKPVLKMNDSTNMALMDQDTVNNIYLADYKLSGTENISFTISGEDSLGNISEFTRTLGVTTAPMNKSVVAKNCAGDFSVSLPSNTFNKDLFVTIWEEEFSNNFDDKVYHFSPVGEELNKPVIVKIKYDDNKLYDINPINLHIYRKSDDGTWVRYDSYIDEANKSIQAEVDKLGDFKLGYNSKFVAGAVNQPTEFELSQNYPNPFNPTTTIKYQIPEDGFVTLTIYDILGKEITKLVNGQKSIGNYQVNFNASNLASGVYFYQIKVNDFTNIKKMMLIK